MVKRKRVFALGLVLALCAALFAPLTALAETGDVRIEQVQAELPDVRAYFYVEGADADLPEAAALAASLDRRALELKQVRAYDPAKDPTSYFFLVDCSTSTTYAQMEAVKTALTAFAGTMPQNSTMTLITFGTDVQLVLQRETDAEKIKTAVAGLAADQPGTVFFDALAKAIDLAGNKDYALERKLAFVFSDSVDYNLGGHTKDEIDKLLAATGLPFYALGFDNGTKQELDNFGAVARTSGGTITIVNAGTLPAALAELIGATQNALVAEFTTGSNIIQASTQEFDLEMTETGKTAMMKVPVRFWQPDTTAPTITEAKQHSAESIQIAFSEAVQGATLPDSFAIKTENGDLLGVKAAAYDDANHTAILTFTEPPASGTFGVECPGVADLSMEKNKVANGVQLAFEGKTPEAPAPAPQPADEGVPMGAWVLIIAAVIAIAAGIIAAAVRAGNKKQQEAEAAATTAAGAAMAGGAAMGGAVAAEEIARQNTTGQEKQVHFVTNEVPLPVITLRVTSAQGTSRVVEVPVNKSLFVGRSDICDVYFDDPAMSRQHFVISEENGLFTIANLSQTKGTLLNGVPLQNPRPLVNGDTIEAGQETIVFRQGPANGAERR